MSEFVPMNHNDAVLPRDGEGGRWKGNLINYSGAVSYLGNIRQPSSTRCPPDGLAMVSGFMDSVALAHMEHTSSGSCVAQGSDQPPLTLSKNSYGSRDVRREDAKLEVAISEMGGQGRRTGEAVCTTQKQKRHHQLRG